MVVEFHHLRPSHYSHNSQPNPNAQVFIKSKQVVAYHQGTYFSSIRVLVKSIWFILLVYDYNINNDLIHKFLMES